MEERKNTLTMRRYQPPPSKTEPERQLGGPQSGFPPPYIIGQDLAPYLIVGIDFGSYFCRVCTFADGGPRSIRPYEFSALVEDALQVPWSESSMVHSLKLNLSEERTVKRFDKIYSPTDLAGRMFKAIKTHVEASTKKMLAKAVIGVPACFTHRQRENVITAARESDVSVLGLINDPTAAVLDACYKYNLDNGRYLVVSVGASSFEATVVHIQNRLVETKAIKGNIMLSGNSLNNVLAKAIQLEFDHPELNDLVILAEAAKRDLDTQGASILNINGKRLELGRVLAKKWLSDFIHSIETLLQELLTAAYTSEKEIDGVVLTGDGAKLWLLQGVLREFFPGAPVRWGDVAAGAAIQAALLVRQAKNWVIWEALACPVYVAQGGHVRQIVTANSPLPINGHALLAPGEDGRANSAILQLAVDRGSTDPVQVASAKIVEELQSSPDEATVDLSVQVTSDGTLQFSARQKIIDVNLAVDVSQPVRDSVEIIQIAQEESSLPPTRDIPFSFGWGIGFQEKENKWFVRSVLDGSPAAKAGIAVYDELIAVDDVKLDDAETPGRMLWGDEGQTRKFEIVNFVEAKTIHIKCTHQSEAEFLQATKTRVADAAIAGEHGSLARALLDFAFADHETYSNDAAVSGVIERAIAVARMVVDEDPATLIRALCSKVVLHLRGDKNETDSCFTVMRAIGSSIEEIISLCAKTEKMTSSAVANMFELAEALDRFSTTSETLVQKRKALLECALTIGSITSISASALQMISRRYTAC